MRVGAVIAVLASACTFSPAGTADGPGDGVDGARIDATPPDADLDANLQTCAWPVMPLNFDPCDQAFPAPGAAVVLGPGAWTYDTDLAVLSGSTETAPPSALLPQDDGPAIRVVSIASLEIEIGATLTVIGAAPLVFASDTTAIIAGVVEVSAVAAIGGSGAAGAGDCAAATTGMAGVLPGGSGGGGGAGFGAAGAAGAAGDATMGGTPGGPGGGGGASGGLTLSPLRGGCTGAAGGAGALAGGLGGGGGGALGISARTSIDVSGAVHASGGGGRSGANRSGGGGGGSGGAILIESEVLTIAGTAALCANGGSGGEGGGTASPNSDGVDGLCSETTAAHTLDGGGAGNGGDGGYLELGAQPGATGDGGRGGGGGGAGVGRIRLRAIGAVIVPGAAIVTPAPA